MAGAYRYSYVGTRVGLKITDFSLLQQHEYAEHLELYKCVEFGSWRLIIICSFMPLRSHIRYRVPPQAYWDD
jgi:hypothetical protein